MDSIRREGERTKLDTETEEQILLTARRAFDSYLVDHMDDRTTWNEVRKLRDGLIAAAVALGRKRERSGVER